jgi:hypothetical protein
MKKLILAATLLMGLQAKADLFNFFDFAEVAQTLLKVSDNIANNLEKVRLAQHEVLDVQQQWDLACETTQSLNQGVVALNKMLSKYKVSQQTCTPISAVLNLQNEIIKNCQNFYSKPVPANADLLLNKFTASLIQSRMILVKCYPSLKDIMIPGLP